MQEWTQLRAECDVRHLESLCAIFTMLDSRIMIEDTSDIGELDTCYGELIDDALLQRNSTAFISIFVPREKSFIKHAELIKQRSEAEGISIKLEVLGRNEDEWADSWKKHFIPLRLSDRLTVVPAWDDDFVPESHELVIRMDPGMAFGAGTHETTRLCIKLLERYITPGAAVLDLGTGSGILAVAASLLGAYYVDACDLDPVAVRVALDNFELNNIKNARAFESDLLSSVKRGAKYDFICANIVADIIIRMSDDVAAFMADGGRLAVSGIINTQLACVTNALTGAGLLVRDRVSDNDWEALLLEKPKDGL